MKMLSLDSNILKIGEIDEEIYKCVTGKITTNEVIITNAQIQHIMYKHPNDFERFSKYFSAIVDDPDYIMEANKPYTAVILKKFRKGDERFLMVLRLCTMCDPPEYKNSIITFMRIDKKRWDRYLRTKKILYKAGRDA